jgi:DNA-binding NarL/FixJ family response regulator
MTKISVLLAEDHVVVRQGLRSLLSAEADIEVVGEAGNGRQAVQMAQEIRPDIVVMDIAMPLLNGLEATSQIVASGIPTRVLILSSYADDEYVHQLTEAGASGYLIKQTAASDLIKAVREIARGNAYFSPSILKRLLELYRESNAKGRLPRRRNEHLTSRELEVLQMVAEGHVNKQIAVALSLSIKTVEKHRQQLMDKLNIHDIAGLTRYAIAHGVVESAGRIRGVAETLDLPGPGGRPAEAGELLVAPSARPR